MLILPSKNGGSDSGRDVKRVLQDITWALGWSVGFGALLSALATVMALLSGSTRFERLELSLVEIVAGYLITSAIVGVIVGLLRPWNRTREGVWVISSIAGIAGAAALGILVWGPIQKWDSFLYVGAVLLGMFFGIGLGDHIYKEHKKDEAKGR